MIETNLILIRKIIIKTGQNNCNSHYIILVKTIDRPIMCEVIQN